MDKPKLVKVMKGTFIVVKGDKDANEVRTKWLQRYCRSNKIIHEEHGHNKPLYRTKLPKSWKKKN